VIKAHGKTTISYVAVALMLLLGVGGGPVLRPAGAAGKKGGKMEKEQKKAKKDKVSPDLRERLSAGNDGGREVEVLLQLRKKPTGQLNALLSRNGVRLKDSFDDFSSMAVSLPPEVIDELASFDEVEIVAPDREVERLGFVEEATGAAEMRRQPGQSGLKGKDVAAEGTAA